MPIYKETFFDTLYRNDKTLHIKAIGLLHNDSDYTITRAQSDTIVLGFVCNGILTLEFDQAQYSITAQQSFLLPPQHAYRLCALQSAPPKLYWINISGELPRLLLAQLFSDTAPLISNCDISPHINFIRANSNHSEEAILQAGVEIFKAIVQIKTNLVRPSFTDQFSLKNDFEQYILNGIQKAFSIQQMAAHFHISTATLTRVFHANFSTTPYRYYCTVRHSIAKSLLQNNELTIEQIALRLHYSDRNHFTTNFLKEEGISPAKYRKHFF